MAQHLNLVITTDDLTTFQEAVASADRIIPGLTLVQCQALFQITTRDEVSLPELKAALLAIPGVKLVTEGEIDV